MKQRKPNIVLSNEILYYRISHVSGIKTDSAFINLIYEKRVLRLLYSSVRVLVENCKLYSIFTSHLIVAKSRLIRSCEREAFTVLGRSEFHIYLLELKEFSGQ